MVGLSVPVDCLAGKSFVAFRVEPLMRQFGEIIERLEGVISSRKNGDPTRSYTSKLLAGGIAVCADKVTEEASELVESAKEQSSDRVVSEAADLIYHTLVLLAARDVAFRHVEDELARRFGVSGLDEKSSRSSASGDEGKA